MEIQLTTEVLGFREKDTSRDSGQESTLWCAMAIEMSLRGYGNTFEEALEELTQAITAQLTFASQKGTIGEILIPAEKKYFDMYALAKRRTLEQLFIKLSDQAKDMMKPEESYDRLARDIPFLELVGSSTKDSVWNINR